jgi:hypothetical protein
MPLKIKRISAGRRWVLWKAVPVKALNTRPQASQR